MASSIEDGYKNIIEGLYEKDRKLQVLQKAVVDIKSGLKECVSSFIEFDRAHEPILLIDERQKTILNNIEIGSNTTSVFEEL